MSDVRSWPISESVTLFGEHLPEGVTPTVRLDVDRGAVVKSRLRTDGVVNVWTDGEKVSFATGAPDGSAAGRAVAAMAAAGRPIGGADIVMESPRRAVTEAEVLTALTGADRQAATDGLAAVCRWEEDGLVLAVVDTGPRHPIADRELSARADDCAKAATELGLDSLADAQIDAFVRCEPGFRPLVQHVITERARIHRVRSVLQRRDWTGFGQLLTSSQTSLSADLQVSTPELDAAAARLVTAGALGARLTGRGFGGELLALLPAEVARRLDLPTAHPRPDGS